MQNVQRQKYRQFKSADLDSLTVSSEASLCNKLISANELIVTEALKCGHSYSYLSQLLNDEQRLICHFFIGQSP
jgi:hypothetical protein